MKRRMPWTKFSFADWERDRALTGCSFAARGFWMAMLCMMDNADDYGVLAVSGKALDATAIAKRVSCDKRTAERHLAELEEADVFSRNEAGAIYSRRMVSDAAKAIKDEANGRLGGNPALVKISDECQHPSVIRPTDAGIRPSSVQQEPSNINIVEEKRVNPEEDKDSEEDKRFASLTVVCATPTPAKAVVKKASDLDPEFLLWWELYPNSIGRAAAAKAYAARRSEGLTAEFLQQAILSWGPLFYRPDYPLHARTWLHQGRWSDMEKSQHHVASHRAVGYKPRPSDWALESVTAAFGKPPTPHYDIEGTAETIST